MSKKSLREKLEDLKKGMRNAGLGGAGSVKAGAVLPSINNKLSKPGHNSLATSIGIPNVAPQSKKNPLKSAEQTQNKDIKDLKMKEAQAALKAKAPQMIKFEKNGQWSLQKDYASKELSDREQKVKNLQRQVDAGTYKPDSSKIAEAMIQPKKVVKFEKNGQWKMVKMETPSTMSYDDAPDSVIDGATINQVEERGSDVNVANVNRPGAEVHKSNYGPKDMKLYNPTDNIKRKKTRTSEVVENVGQNKGVRQYTTSGSSTDKARSSAELKRQKAANKKAPVKTLKDMDPKVVQELRDKYETKGKS